MYGSYADDRREDNLVRAERNKLVSDKNRMIAQFRLLESETRKKAIAAEANDQWRRFDYYTGKADALNTVIATLIA